MVRVFYLQIYGFTEVEGEVEDLVGEVVDVEDELCRVHPRHRVEDDVLGQLVHRIMLSRRGEHGEEVARSRIPLVNKDQAAISVISYPLSSCLSPYYGRTTMVLHGKYLPES